jgi:serine/threonine protein kinase
MVTVSLNDLMETIRQHRLLKPSQIEQLVEELGTASAARFADPQELVKELHRRGWITVFQGRQLLRGQGASLVLGHYLLLDLLGEGGMGRVYKARHQSMERTVALKILRPDLLRDPEAVGRFYREVEVISRLSHPAIVHAYDAGGVGSTLFLALEYIEGTDLDRLVRESGQLPVAQACDYIRQAALGLQYAHEQGLVHRDIKPSNLLLAKAQGSPSLGLVKILDLGLARLQQPARESRTSNLTVIAGNSAMQGTPDYLAPEQAIDFHSADIRADIYSLGCTFYFLLTAQPPFGGGSLSQKLIRHHQAEAAPVEKVRPGVPSGVSAVIRKMLAKQPAERYQTPGEVAEALKPFCEVSSPSIQAKTPSTMSFNADFTPASGITGFPPVQPARPRRGRKIVLGLLGMALLVGIAGVLFRPGSDGAKRSDSSSAAPPSPTEPALRLALQFNGNNNLIPLPDDIFRSSQTLTLEAWFRTSGSGAIIGHQHKLYPQDQGSYVPVLSVGTDGRLRCQFWNGGMNPITSGARVNDNAWHHVALVADDAAKMQTLYLDGNVVGLLAGELRHLDMTHSQIGLAYGGWPDTRKPWHAFEGNIAEVRIWNVVRSQAAIQQAKDKPLAGNEAGLVGYFPLNELLGDTALDRSPLGRPMSLGAGVVAQKPVRKMVTSFMK